MSPQTLVVSGAGVLAMSYFAAQALPGVGDIQSSAEHLTLISALCFGVVAFLFEWVLPGKTAQRRIDTAVNERDAAVKDASANADARVAETRSAYERQMDQLRADFQRQLEAKDREIERLQLAEQQWQQITLNSLGELDRNGRLLERGIVAPLERELQSRRRLSPGTT
jgi:vacuolar-type H+-ATPase subunit H